MSCVACSDPIAGKPAPTGTSNVDILSPDESVLTLSNFKITFRHAGPLRMPDALHKLFRNTPAMPMVAPAAMHKLSGFFYACPGCRHLQPLHALTDGKKAPMLIRKGRFDVTGTAWRKAHRGCEPRCEQRGHFEQP